MHGLTFEIRCIYYTGVLIYKSRSHLVRKYIEDLLQIVKNEHYNLRSTNKGDHKKDSVQNRLLTKQFFLHEQNHLNLNTTSNKESILATKV